MSLSLSWGLLGRWLLLHLRRIHTFRHSVVFSKLLLLLRHLSLVKLLCSLVLGLSFIPFELGKETESTRMHLIFCNETERLICGVIQEMVLISLLWRALLINHQFQKFDGLLFAHLVSAIFRHHLWPKLFNFLSESVLLILSQPYKLVIWLDRFPIFVGQLLNLVHILSNWGLLLFLWGHSGLSCIPRREHVLHPLRFHA